LGPGIVWAFAKFTKTCFEIFNINGKRGGLVVSELAFYLTD